MSFEGIGSSWSDPLGPGAKLAKMEGVFNSPPKTQTSSLLRTPGVEVHVDRLVDHNVPLPESFSQYELFTKKMAEQVKNILPTLNLDGGIIIRSGRFELVDDKTKAAYDEFVTKGYLLQDDLEDIFFHTDNNKEVQDLARDIRITRDKIILEIEEANDSGRGANLNKEIDNLAASFVNILLKSAPEGEFALENRKSKLAMFCDYLEKSAYDCDSLLLNDESKGRLLSTIEASGALEESWDIALNKAQEWLSYRKNNQALLAQM